MLSTLIPDTERSPGFMPLPAKDRMPLNFIFAHEVNQLPKPAKDITPWGMKKNNVVSMKCIQSPFPLQWPSTSVSWGGKWLKKKNYVVNIEFCEAPKLENVGKDALQMWSKKIFLKGWSLLQLSIPTPLSHQWENWLQNSLIFSRSCHSLAQSTFKWVSTAHQKKLKSLKLLFKAFLMLIQITFQMKLPITY